MNISFNSARGTRCGNHRKPLRRKHWRLAKSGGVGTNPRRSGLSIEQFLHQTYPNGSWKREVRWQILKDSRNASCASCWSPSKTSATWHPPPSRKSPRPSTWIWRKNTRRRATEERGTYPKPRVACGRISSATGRRSCSAGRRTSARRRRTPSALPTRRRFK